MTADLDKF